MASERTSPLARLHHPGQCYWLDSLSRPMLDDGSLAAKQSGSRLNVRRPVGQYQRATKVPGGETRA